MHHLSHWFPSIQWLEGLFLWASLVCFVCTMSHNCLLEPHHQPSQVGTKGTICSGNVQFFVRVCVFTDKLKADINGREEEEEFRNVETPSSFCSLKATQNRRKAQLFGGLRGPKLQWSNANHVSQHTWFAVGTLQIWNQCFVFHFHCLLSMQVSTVN